MQSPVHTPLPAVPRVAIIHDWLFGMRGGERVLESMLRLFPAADIYTLFHSPAGISPAINQRVVRASPLGALPGVQRYYRYLLPLFPAAIRAMHLPPRYDIVLSSSHCVAHAIHPPAGARHVVYCHSPMRYLYDQSEAYARGGGGIPARALRLFAPALRRWDRAAARRPGKLYLANSHHVAERIRRVYGLESTVVHPPVRTDYFTPPLAPRSPDAPWLIVSALAPYKRIDLAIHAANELGKKLWIAGTGQADATLRALAGPTVRFLGWVDDARLRELYQTSAGLLFPGEEDFGIVPIEAMACGLPVLALRAGALRETNLEGVTGAFFDTPTTQSLADAWRQFDPATYDPAAIRRHAEGFGEERFLRELAAALALETPE